MLCHAPCDIADFKRVAACRFLPQVRWITFHSGYDFGYLLKLLTCQSLPANEAEFFELLKARALLPRSPWGMLACLLRQLACIL